MPYVTYVWCGICTFSGVIALKMPTTQLTHLAAHQRIHGISVESIDKLS